MPQRRHVVRAVVSAATATSVLALTSPAWAASDLTLRHSNVTAGGFGTQQCGDSRFANLPDDHDGWHFVLPARNSGDFLSLRLTFRNGTRTVTVTVPDSTDAYPDAFYSTGGQNPQRKHAYVFTPAGWTLVSGTAKASGEGDVFNLSHTCAGEPSTAPTQSPTPTPSGSVSPTPGATATTTAPADPSGSPAPGGSTNPTPGDSVTPTSDSSVTPTISVSPAAGGGSGGGGLPLTGAAVTTIALLGLALIGGGAALVVLRRRKDSVTFTS